MKTKSCKIKSRKLRRVTTRKTNKKTRKTYQKEKLFEKFKENVKSIEMVKQFDYGKSTIIFKIRLARLFNKHPNIKNPTLSLIFLKNYFKFIKEIHEENGI